MSGISSLFICKNRHSPLSGGFNEAKVGLVITAFGRLSPLPASSIIGIREALKGKLPPVHGPLEFNYLIIG